MKKIFLAVVIIMITATVTFAKSNIDRKDRKSSRIEEKEARKELRLERRVENSNEVSDLTKNNFASDFPDAKNVDYVRTNEFDEVFFKEGNKNLNAYYDADNKLVGTTQEISFTDLPANAQKEILKKYAGYSIASVIKFDDNESNETDMIMYGTTLDDTDNYFVELKNDSKSTVVKVDPSGEVFFFKDIK